MSTDQIKEGREQNISNHIFSASVTMVGVCLTAIGLFRISYRLKSINTVADELLALDGGDRWIDRV